MSSFVGGEGSTSQSSRGEVGVGKPSEPWNVPLSAGDLAAFTQQGQQAIYNLQSFFGQVTMAVFHVKLPDDRDLVFDSADVDGSIAVLVHRIALEMKQSVSTFGSPSHTGLAFANHGLYPGRGVYHLSDGVYLSATWSRC